MSTNNRCSAVKIVCGRWLNNLLNPLGDGEQTFREKEIQDKLPPGVLPPREEHLKTDLEYELKRIDEGIKSDHAQFALKNYFSALSENTETILGDPRQVLKVVK